MTLNKEKILRNLESRQPILSRDVSVSPAEPEDPDLQDELPQEDPLKVPEVHQDEQSRPDKRRKAVNLRTERLGQNPRESRRLMREHLEPGFYLSYSGKKSYRTLHRLGSCYNLPGAVLQISSEYDKICSKCARKDVSADPENSSGTCTSSSTDAEDPDVPVN